jgi:alkanesulfonate monooxygenase SsuD/methylene tetrahydromethanopterin reductase-like flavin-dependent oxidoreductase (luciferase family)
MRFLFEPLQPATIDDITRAGESARAHGLDGALLSTTASLPAPLIAAAALAARVPDIRIAAEVLLDRHPIEVAEEAAVVDVASGGRLMLIVRPAGGSLEAFAEALDILRHAFAAKPFSYAGAHWRVPAKIEANSPDPGGMVRVTPAPAQPQLPVWAAGAGQDAALARSLGYLADADATGEQLARAWAAAATPASIGTPRARRDVWSDASSMVARLRAARASFGQDWSVISAPIEAVPSLGSIVRPRVQLDKLPPGLERYWDEQRPWTCRDGDA